MQQQMHCRRVWHEVLSALHHRVSLRCEKDIVAAHNGCARLRMCRTRPLTHWFHIHKFAHNRLFVDL